MTNWRMLPTTVAASQTVVVAGRTYTKTPGSFLDVPDFDARVLLANGWTKVGEVGTTAQRPTQLSQALPVPPGYHYYDTTVASTIWWDGATWRNAAGTSV